MPDGRGVVRQPRLGEQHVLLHGLGAHQPEVLERAGGAEPRCGIDAGRPTSSTPR